MMTHNLSEFDVQKPKSALRSAASARWRASIGSAPRLANTRGPRSPVAVRQPMKFRDTAQDPSHAACPAA